MSNTTRRSFLRRVLGAALVLPLAAKLVPAPRTCVENLVQTTSRELFCAKDYRGEWIWLHDDTLQAMAKESDRLRRDQIAAYLTHSHPTPWPIALLNPAPFPKGLGNCS